MTNTLCDTERCEACQQDFIEGVDETGRCATCAGGTSLDHLLRLMAAGVTRDKATGQFVSVATSRASALAEVSR